MDVLFDTNVILDSIRQRIPWHHESDHLLKIIDRGEIIGYVSASVVTDIFYIAKNNIGAASARIAARECLNRFEVLSIDYAVLDAAEKAQTEDFEDAVMIVAATMNSL